MSEDESLRRLQAADPAQGQSTDLDALRHAVDARLRDEGPGEAEAAAPATDELDARRSRRSRRMSWVAGAAASVLVGVSGYMVGVGTAGSSGDDAADLAYEDGGDAADGEALTGASGADDAEIDGGTAEGSAGDDPISGGEDGDTMLAGGRVRFEASGLSTETGTAEAFAYDAAGIAGAEQADEIAETLGVDGDLAERDGAWVVTDADGRIVELYNDGTATISYHDPTLDPWACAVGVNDTSSPDELASCDATASPADPVAAARQFLEAAGVETGALRLVADQGGSGAVDVYGYPEGATSLTWTVTVTADGVYSAWGWLAPLVSLGSYDVVSPVTAVDRLSDPRFGAGPSGMVTYEAAGADSSSSGPPSSVPEPGATLPWPVETRTITGAELTLVAYPIPGGSTTLLPAWSLTSGDGGTWLVLAVTDEFLDFDAQGN